MRIDRRIEARMNSLVHKDYQRLLPRAVEALRNKRVGVEDQRIYGCRSLLVLDVCRWWPRILRFIDIGDVAQLLILEQIIDLLHHLVCAEVWRSKDAAGVGWTLRRRLRLSVFCRLLAPSCAEDQHRKDSDTQGQAGKEAMGRVHLPVRYGSSEEQQENSLTGLIKIFARLEL